MAEKNAWIHFQISIIFLGDFDYRWVLVPNLFLFDKSHIRSFLFLVLTALPNWPLHPPVKSLLDDFVMCFWYFTLHLLPLRMKTTRSILWGQLETLIIIRAIIITLQQLLSPSLAVPLLVGWAHGGKMLIKIMDSLTNWWLWVQQESLFTPFKRGSNQKPHPSTLSSPEGSESCRVQLMFKVVSQHAKNSWLLIIFNLISSRWFSFDCHFPCITPHIVDSSVVWTGAHVLTSSHWWMYRMSRERRRSRSRLRIFVKRTIRRARAVL